MKSSPGGNVIDNIATAKRVTGEIPLNAADPAAEWEHAQPIHFSADWQGKNSDPNFQTELRLLWTLSTLYLRFVSRYRELFLFPDSEPNGRRDHLWDRDVAEAFLQTDPSPQRYYKEFEIAPNGMWIDLDITPSGLADLKSGLSRSVHLDEQKKIWAAELAIPIKSITSNFDPGHEWRANFYRIEGKTEPRRYMAWQATKTPQPNFHVPEAFGILRFIE
jgi:Carbohydrate-binding family 9